MMTGSRVALFALVLMIALPGATLLAHNGEYKPQSPPPLPKVERPPGSVTPRGGVPTWKRKRAGTPTPMPTSRKPTPGAVTPEPSTPKTDGRSLGRRDDRFRWDVWWEMDSTLFLGPRQTLEGAARTLALEAIGKTLGDQDTIVRSRALLVLARLGDDRVPDMAEALIAGNEPGQHAATLALGLARGAGAGEAESTLKLLRKMLQDDRRSIASRTLAITALGLTGEDSQKTILREIVDEERRPNLRSAAIIGLGLLRDEESVARLRRLLVSRRGNGVGDLDPLDDLVRCASAYALGRIGTPAGRMALLNALEEGDGLSGGSAALALGNIGDPSSRAALREAITADRPFPTRAMAIVALARRGDKPSAETIRTMLGQGDLARTELGGVGILALGLVGAEPETALLSGILDDDTCPIRNRAAAAAALGRLAARGAIVPLRQLTPRAKVPLFRAHLVLALARAGGAAADGPIRKNLELGKTDVLRRLTMDALAVRGGDSYAGILVNSFADAYLVNRKAVRALSRLDPARALTGAIPRLEDPKNPRARRFGADAVGWLLTTSAPELDIARGMNPLCGMPLIQALLYVGGEEYLYDMSLGL